MSDHENESKRTETRRKRRLADLDYSTDTDYSSPAESSPKSPRSPDSHENSSEGNNNDGPVMQHSGSSDESVFEQPGEAAPEPENAVQGEDMQENTSGSSSSENHGADVGHNLAEYVAEVFPEVIDPNIADLGIPPPVGEEEANYSTDEEIDINYDEEEADIAGGPRRHDPPLYRGSPITLGQSMLAILSFVVAHQCSGAALADLLGLIALHCILEDNVCVKTLYRFKKFFQDVRSPLTRHYFCSKCFSPLQTNDSICQGDLCDDQSGVSFFCGNFNSISTKAYVRA